MLITRILTAAVFVGATASLCVAQDAGGAGAGGDDAADVGALRTLNKNYVNTDLKESVRKGLKRLADLQSPNGSFTKEGGSNVGIAITGLAGLALLASGSTAESGPYSANVLSAMTWLLSKQDLNSGYFTDATDSSRIHGHGYATLFLAQLYGTVKNVERKKLIERSVQAAAKCISEGQTPFGGWGYVPTDLTWDEGSTTVCCIQALRAASDAGIKVEKETIQEAVNYMYKISEKRTFLHAGEEHTGYTFKYSLSSGWNSDSYALCAASIATLNGIGVYAEGATWKEMEIGKIYSGGLTWLRYKFDDFVNRRKSGQGALDVSHFYYGHFYACQAMWHAPEEVYFDEYFPKMRDLLIDEQKRNPANTGGWASQSYGEAYTTAYALLILQVPMQLLPMYAK
jgi:hypothetical protein